MNITVHGSHMGFLNEPFGNFVLGVQKKKVFILEWQISISQATTHSNQSVMQKEV